jgi:preprotein translocase subunit SecE
MSSKRKWGINPAVRRELRRATLTVLGAMVGVVVLCWLVCRAFR